MWKKIRQLTQKNGFISLVGNGFSAALGIAVFAVQARTLNDADFAAWVIFLTTFNLFDIIRSGLILNPVVRHIASAKTTIETVRYAGAAWQLATVITLVAVSGFSLPGLVFYNWFADRGIGFFVLWFWLLALITLPHNLATWFLTAHSQFKKLQWVRILNQGIFLTLNLLNYKLQYGILYVFWSYVCANAATSLLCIALQWSRLRAFNKGRRNERKELFSFGKYSMLTLVAANLLRSSDTYLIGALLGPMAVVVYSIPQRLLEIFEMPIRSISITSLPVLSALYSEGKQKELKESFHRNAGALWMGILPLSLLCFIFAEPLVVLLGGEGHAESVAVLRFFTVYAAFLPLERYSGIGLDVAYRPQLNLSKVLVMLTLNIIGDVVAIYWFGTAASVAFVSILTFGCGVVLGFRLLNPYIKISISGFIKEGYRGLEKIVKH